MQYTMLKFEKKNLLDVSFNKIFLFCFVYLCSPNMSHISAHPFHMTIVIIIRRKNIIIVPLDIQLKTAIHLKKKFSTSKLNKT